VRCPRKVDGQTGDALGRCRARRARFVQTRREAFRVHPLDALFIRVFQQYDRRGCSATDFRRDRSMYEHRDFQSTLRPFENVESVFGLRRCRVARRRPFTLRRSAHVSSVRHARHCSPTARGTNALRTRWRHRLAARERER